MYHVHDGAHRGQKGTSDSPGTEVPGNYELPCRCLELNLDPVQKQAVFLSCWVTSHTPGNSKLKFFLILFNILKIHVIIDVYAL